MLLALGSSNSQENHIEVITVHASMQGYLQIVSSELCRESETPHVDKMLRGITLRLEPLEQEVLLAYAKQQGRDSAYATFSQKLIENKAWKVEDFCSWADVQAKKAIRFL